MFSIVKRLGHSLNSSVHFSRPDRRLSAHKFPVGLAKSLLFHVAFTISAHTKKPSAAFTHILSMEFINLAHVQCCLYIFCRHIRIFILFHVSIYQAWTVSSSSKIYSTNEKKIAHRYYLLVLLNIPNYSYIVTMTSARHLNESLIVLVAVVAKRQTRCLVRKHLKKLHWKFRNGVWLVGFSVLFFLHHTSLRF